MPGAQLQEIEGDEYRGVVKVKVGPITAQYKGAARIVEADEAARRIVLKGEGRDTRGQGNASATVTVTLAEDGTGTTVGVDTDLNITGKVAQFGRGVMADVSAKLLAQFVASLEADVLNGSPTADAPSPADSTGASPADSVAPTASAPSDAPAGGIRRIDAPEVAPVDLMDAAGGAVAKRLVPVLAGVGGLVVLLWLLRRLFR
jgi:carbon monoxide dehydrogenase subunit G